MCNTTYVTKTRKKWGRHIYWLSHAQHKAIRTKDCKSGCEFEIKTDNSAGHCTLPPSIHRDDPSYHYQSIGRETISIQEGLYDGLLRALDTCIRQEKLPGEQSKRRYTYNDSPSGRRNYNLTSLTDMEIQNITNALQISYNKNSRHNIVYALSGYLYKSNVALDSSKKVVASLCHATNDEESKSRMIVLETTYAKAQNGEQVAGHTYLKDVLIQNIGEEMADSVLYAISQIVGYQNPLSDQLSDAVARELSAHIYQVVCYSPITLIIAHSYKKQILTATVGTINQKDDSDYSNHMQYIRYGNVIIDAVPTRITKYENPSNIEIKYEIEFETSTDQSLRVQPANLDEILGYLKVNGLVYKVRSAEEALPAILNACYREGKMTIKREIETPGFYLINNEIETYKTEHEQPTVEDIRRCADLLLLLQLKYKRKEIFPTVLKCGIMAPFSYILKQMVRIGCPGYFYMAGRIRARLLTVRSY